MELFLRKYRNRMALVVMICTILGVVISVFDSTKEDDSGVEKAISKFDHDASVSDKTRRNTVNVLEKNNDASVPNSSELGSQSSSQQHPKELSSSPYLSADDSKIGISPYQCSVPDSDITLSSWWRASKARAILIDNGGSRARVLRGQTYAQFMDAFWLEIEQRGKQLQLNSVEDLFFLIAEAFKEANQKAGGIVRGQNVEPFLMLRSRYIGPTGLYASQRDIFDAGDLGVTGVDNVRPFKTHLDNLNRGIDVFIMFQREPTSKFNPTDFIMMSVVDDLGVDGRRDIIPSPILTQLLGFRSGWDSYSYWDEINLKDGYLCHLSN